MSAARAARAAQEKNVFLFIIKYLIIILLCIY